MEQTGLPNACQLSQMAHDRLVNSGLLQEGACEHPSDLEALAQAVSHREDLVRCLHDLLADAPPNDGHRILAGLMLEGAVSTVLTINFDLALTSALSVLGGFQKVRQIKGKDEIGQIAGSNLIYLHGTIDSSPTEWVLTSAEVENDREHHWRGVLTASVLAIPVVVFAGIGAAVGVLLSSLQKIQEQLSEGQVVLLVDPGNVEESEFYHASNLDADCHVKEGWIDFAESLGKRLQNQIASELVQAAEQLLAENSDWPDLDLQSSGEAYRTLGFLKAGFSRASWLGSDGRYLAWNGSDHRRFAHLLLAVARIADHTGTTPWFTERGVAHFDNHEHSTTRSVLLVHGGGTLSWTTLLSRRSQMLRRIEGERYRPSVVVGGGMWGKCPADIAAHRITGDVDPTSIVEGADSLRYHSVEEIMANPGALAS